MPKRKPLRLECNGHWLKGRLGPDGWTWASDFADIARDYQGFDIGVVIAAFQRRALLGGVSRRLARKEK